MVMLGWDGMELKILKSAENLLAFFFFASFYSPWVLGFLGFNDSFMSVSDRPASGNSLP